MTATQKHLYLIYDELAVILGDTDEAHVLEACASLRDVTLSDHDPQSPVFQYDVEKALLGEQDGLINELFVGTIAQVRRKAGC